MLVFENFRDIYFREIGDGAGTPGGAREATKGWVWGSKKHDGNAIRVFENVLGADKSTFELLQKGFRLDRNFLPKHYREKNNRTAREDLYFCLKKTLEYKNP